MYNLTLSQFLPQTLKDCLYSTSLTPQKQIFIQTLYWISVFNPERSLRY